MNIDKIKVGDFFSELSYYKLISKNPVRIELKHLKNGEEVSFATFYVRDFLISASQFDKEVSVGKEDKYWTQKQIDDYKNAGGDSNPQVGDRKQKGIKTIWSEIGSKVFTVCFEKQGKTLSKKAYETKVKELSERCAQEIEDARVNKRGVSNRALDIIEDLIRNPLLDYEKGEERILRGYKVSHESDNGFYTVVDLDITTDENKRQVNLNTIKYLIVDGVKYVVE